MPQRNPFRNLQSQIERFNASIDRSGGSDACHMWTKSTNDGGYGQFRLGGKVVKAHRLAWAIAKNGGNLPEANVDIHHTCESRYVNKRHARKCCNPNHLQAIEGAIHDAMHQRERHQ